MRENGKVPEMFGPRAFLLVSLCSTAACHGTEGRVLFQIDASAGGGADADHGRDAAPADDGDAVTDATTRVNIVLSGHEATAVYGLGDAQAYEDLCPEQQALIGVRGHLAFVLGQPTNPILIGALEGVCGELALDHGRITVTEASRLPERGQTRDEPFTLICPEDEVVVRFAGRSGLLMDQLGFTCASLRVVAETTRVSLREATTLSPVGGPGGSPFDDGCAIGQIARGVNMYAGDLIDRFGLVCGTPVLERAP